MQIGSFHTASAAGPGAAKPASDLAARREQVIDSLRGTREDDKALAKARLERARQFLAMLERWGFPPDVIARQAAKLGVETRSALQQYLSATDATDAGTVSVDTSSDGDPAPSATVDPEETADDALPAGNFARKAYLEAMDGSGEAGRFSAEDRTTIAEFEAVLRETRALLEKAEREKDRMDATADGEDAGLAPVHRGLSPRAG